MARKKKLKVEKEADVPIESMIDIIFLLIIFFVVTADMENDTQDDKITLASAPNGKPLAVKDPRSVYINVREDGEINMSGRVIPMKTMSRILKTSAAEFGMDIPIIVRGHVNTDHEYIKQVMKAVTDTGLYRVKFNAIIDQ